MISFDLRCHGGHVFEVWFRSSADHLDQAARGLIVCPVCNDTRVAKALMAPNVAAKGSSRDAPPAKSRGLPSSPASGAAAQPVVASGEAPMPSLPPEAVAMLSAIAEAQAKLLPTSRWVGRRFAEEARALHRASEDGDIDTVPAIHGQATREEAEALADDGIAVMPLLVPVVPPEMKN